MDKKLTCYFVDDQKDSVERLEYLLDKYSYVRITGYNTCPMKAIDEIKKTNPQIVFVDVEMPNMSGFELIEKIRAFNHDVKFVFTTGYSQYAIKAIKAEAYDYLLKPIDLDELKTTLDRLRNTSQTASDLNTLNLSEREKEIIELLAKSYTSQQIADELFISKNTVDTHRRNILEKNNAKNTQELLLGLNQKFS